MKVIVINDYTDVRYTYDFADLLKARIAAEYLTTTTPYYWYTEIIAV